MDKEVSDFLTRIQTLDDLESLRREFEKTASNYGFPYFAYLGMKLPGRKHGNPLLVSTYPVDWTDHYMEERYFTLDPVVVQAGQLILPFIWGTKDMRGQLRGRQKLLFNEAKEFEIRCGFTVPIHGHGGEFAAVTVANNEPDRSFLKQIDAFQHQLHLMALHYHVRVSRLVCAEGVEPEKVVLTPRETECLLWVAKGKTAWEISVILGISKSTVIFHIKNAKQKFGVYSVNQAVVRSVMSGLIHP